MPSLHGRSSRPMRGVMTDSRRFPGGGRGRGFVARLDHMTVRSVGCGKGIHPKLVVGSVRGPSRVERGRGTRVSAPSLEIDSVPRRTYASVVSAPSAEADSITFDTHTSAPAREADHEVGNGPHMSAPTEDADMLQIKSQNPRPIKIT